MSVPRFWNVMAALSQLIKAAVFGGNPDITTSAWLYYRDRVEGRSGWARRLVDALFRDPAHCREAARADLQNFTPAQQAALARALIEDTP